MSEGVGMTKAFNSTIAEIVLTLAGPHRVPFSPIDVATS